MNFIITGLNEKYWNPWGACWIASLKEFAHTNATLVVIDHGLSKSTKNYLKEENIVLYPSIEKGRFRNATISTIVHLSEEMQGNFVYYDADVWFQNPIDDIFDIINNKIIVAKNANSGFLAGNSNCFRRYKTVSKFAKYMKDEKVFECFVKYFDYDLDLIDDKFNFINLPDLYSHDNLLMTSHVTPSAIHPTGIFKHISRNKNLLFHERFPDIFKRYVYFKKSQLPKKLFKKT